jgi:hypothetical protein
MLSNSKKDIQVYQGVTIESNDLVIQRMGG